MIQRSDDIPPLWMEDVEQEMLRAETVVGAPLFRLNSRGTDTVQNPIIVASRSYQYQSN